MTRLSLSVIFVFITVLAGAQADAVSIYPSNWWTGMKHNRVQLLVRSPRETGGKVSISYPGVSLTAVHRFANAHYLALDIVISPAARPGSVAITLAGNRTVHWLLKQRRSGNGSRYAQGVTSKDLIYLLMPDRFSNGNALNDTVNGMLDNRVDRDSIFYRHGGDLQGVTDHLDYLQDLGVTALWLTPVIRNDMPERSEHGYAFTDHYFIEPRFGGAAAYRVLSDSLHARGMKLIQDAVYNHIGANHWIVKEPPDQTWLHRWPQFTQTSYKDQPLFDPHGSKKDKEVTEKGWFVKQMPDLDQGNPFVANFLIQHAIWCTEEFGVDGWRIDTYLYNDLNFMNRCNAELLKEYPHITMFGETWVHGTANQAYFARNNIRSAFKSNLPGVTDFQLNLYGINPALTHAFGWTTGVSALYQTLSNDFLYEDPTRNVIFLDNHDMTRFLSQVDGDINKLKMGVTWLMTCRGIPELYYGTEVLMKGIANPDGNVRLDFPGGWPGDKTNAFTGAGLTKDQTDMQGYVRKLANFRKSSSALTTGRLMQYLPVDGLYVYFRYDARQTIMCVMNTSLRERGIDLEDYKERTSGFSRSTDIFSGDREGKHFSIPAMSMRVLELK